jgi:hypothetical protein
MSLRPTPAKLKETGRWKGAPCVEGAEGVAGEVGVEALAALGALAGRLTSSARTGLAAAAALARSCLLPLALTAGEVRFFLPIGATSYPLADYFPWHFLNFLPLPQ